MSEARRPVRAAYRPVKILAVLWISGLLIAVPDGRAQSGGAAGRWVGTWATALVERPQGAVPGGRGGRGGAPPPEMRGRTLRQIVHVSLGGDRVRVVFSNVFGTAPLAIGAAHVALRSEGAAIAGKDGGALTFNGRPMATIPPGAVLVTDPLRLAVPPFADLAVDLFVPADGLDAASPLTMHNGALQTSYVSAPGNHAGASALPVEGMIRSWFFLARVDVEAGADTAAVVAFGDSITDGTRSTPDGNHRWPDALARRLAAQGVRVGVLNLGIAGNRVLTDGAGVSALARFDRDVLAPAGATHVIVLESINDIGIARDGASPTVDDLILGQRQIIARARARGLRVLGGTLLPFEGAAYFTAVGETKRQAFNQWVRTSGAYDGVVDFDAAVRDPDAPGRLLDRFNSGDNLHLNDAGYEAMAAAVDLALLGTGAAGAIR